MLDFEIVYWDSSMPLSGLSVPIRDKFIVTAAHLYYDLKANYPRQEVVVAPYPKFASHQIRKAVTRCPGWYRYVYYSFPQPPRRRGIKKKVSCARPGRNRALTNCRRDSFIAALERIMCFTDR
ncbi:MAG: hypothetical protein V1659_04585, partial [Candidatus Woesearchaeota archaeon]